MSKPVWKKTLDSVLVLTLALAPVFIPLATSAQDFPQDFPSDPGGLDEFGGGSSGGNSDSGFGLGNISGLFSTSGGSCGGSSSSGGGGGGMEVPTRDTVVRNETQRIRTNTGELVRKECVLDPIVKAVTAIILKTLTSQIISWIQNSGVGFVQNYELYFRQIEERRASEFRTNLLSTQMGYGVNQYVDTVLNQPRPGNGSLVQKFECNSPVLRNGDFNRNFDNGGWDAFLQKMSDAPCNAEGGVLLGLDEESAKISQVLSSESRNLAQNRGNVGYRAETKEQCEEVYDEDGNKALSCTTETETQTPGDVVADLMTRSFGSGIDWVIGADEVNEAITSAIMFLADTLIRTSSGSGGEGVFSPELSQLPTSSPGPFSQSTLTVQLNTQITRADKGIEIIDGRMSDALNALFKEYTILTDLRAKRAALVVRLASATEPSDIAAINAEIVSTDALINSSLLRISSEQAKLTAAVTAKENIAKARADLIKTRTRLFTTTNLQDVEIIATDLGNLSNALDIFFEISGLTVVTLTETADIKISTMGQIERSNAIGARAVSLASSFESSATSLGAPALTSQVSNVASRRQELGILLSELASRQTALNLALATEPIRTSAIAASDTNIRVTAKTVEISTLIGRAINAYAP